MGRLGGRQGWLDSRGRPLHACGKSLDRLGAVRPTEGLQAGDSGRCVRTFERVLDGELCGSGHGAGRGSPAEHVYRARSKAEDGAPGTAAAGERQGERGLQGGRGLQSSCRGASTETAPGSGGGGEARMTRALCQSMFSGEVAGEPFCTFRTRLGYKQRQGDGPWRLRDAGTASALMGGLSMGRRGDARGNDGGRGPGETGGGRSQSPAEEGRGHGSSFRDLTASPRDRDEALSPKLHHRPEERLTHPAGCGGKGFSRKTAKRVCR